MDTAPEGLPTWLAALVGIVFIAGLLLIGFLINERKNRRLKALADDLGLTYYERAEGRVPVPSYVHHLKPGLFKTAPEVRRVMLGEVEGTPVWVFQLYRFMASKSDRKQWGYSQTVALFHVPGLDLPKFSLLPESLHHKVMTAFGAPDIDFPDSPRFSRRFLLRSDDEESIRTLFTQVVRRWLENHRGRIVQGLANELVYYQPTKKLCPYTFRPGHIRKLVKEGIELANLLKG